MNHTLIKQVNEFSFLGLTVKSYGLELAHHQHIKQNNKNYGHHEQNKEINPTTILPHIYFCITAWGFKCNRILTLQKKALRIMITKSKFNSHTEPLFRELSMLKVEHIFQMQCLKLYYNEINERTPDFFSRKCLNYKAACTLTRQGRKITSTLPELVLHLQNNASDNTYQLF